MRYQPLPASFYTKNRERLAAAMKPNSVAVIFSNDLSNRGADSNYKWRQNPDLFYLTGIEQEETILVLCPDCINPDYREVLFIREPNDLLTKWEGEKLSKEKARALSGARKIVWTEQFDSLIYNIVNLAENLYLHINEHFRYTGENEYADLRQARQMIQRFPLHHRERLAPIMHKLRFIKQEDEIKAMRKACDITGKAFDKVLRFLKPGVMEYEVEAEIIAEFIRNGSGGHAYEPIIASGHNAVILHYVDNDRPCKDGDLVLMDFGCELGGYASDLTRTIPVNGRYTRRQKDVYNAVLDIHKWCVTQLRPGNNLQDYQQAVIAKTAEKCVELGLITEEDIRDQDPANPAVRRYFYHGASHHLGLDVHDVGNVYLPMQEGMVFTVEPGIYIAEEGIGVRIENDYVIRANGAENLMANIPIEVEDIEAIMQSNGR